jgi:sister-chromatid-cohesion protein PDS5
MDSDVEWFEDNEVPPELTAKVLCLKVCRNRSLAHASSDTAVDISTPVLKMLTSLIDNNGAFSAESGDKYVQIF